jgi:hypothetical protein
MKSVDKLKAAIDRLVSEAMSRPSATAPSTIVKDGKTYELDSLLALVQTTYECLNEVAYDLDGAYRGGHRSSTRYECIETLVKKALDLFSPDVTAQEVFNWIVKKIKRRQKELEADLLTTDCLECPCEGDDEKMYEVRAYPGATSVQDNKLTVTVVSGGDRSKPHPIAWRTFSENYVAKIRKELTGPQ